MKINRKELLAAMKIATKIASGKGSFPILQCVLLDGAGQQLIATDLETTGFIPLEIKDYTRTVPVEGLDLEGLKGPELRQLAKDKEITLPAKAKVAEIREAIMASQTAEDEEVQEKFCLPAKDFQKILSTLEEDEVEIAGTEEGITTFVQIGENFHNMATSPVDEFPEMEKAVEVKTSATIVGVNLMNVVMAASREDEGYNLKQVHFDLSDPEKPYAVATDAKRMHWASVVATGDESFGIPLNAVNIVASVFPEKDAEISIQFDGEQLIQIPFGEKKGIIQVTASGGRFPDWKGMAEGDSEKEVTIVKADLEKPIQQALSLSAGDYRKVMMTFNGGIDLEFTNPDKGDYQKVSIPIKKKSYGEDEILLGVNGKFVLDALKPITTEDVTLRFDTTKPLRLAHENFNALIMPMRV